MRAMMGFCVPVVALAGGVDGRRLVEAEREPGQWMMDGRNYDGAALQPAEADQRAQRRASSGSRGSRSSSTFRGVEATPLAVDGVLYNIMRLQHHHRVRRRRPARCCGPTIRRCRASGAAMRAANRWRAASRCGSTTVIIGTLDGRLISLDAATGKPEWSVQTFDKDWPYSITGAPRVFDGNVVVGNGGADFGVRGFVAAYDAETGKPLWKFFLVPGDPSKGFDERLRSVMAMAAKTWNGRVVEARRRRHRVGFIQLRPEAASSSTSAPATARRSCSSIAARAAATTCSCAPSSRSMRTPANTAGTTRKRPARNGTTPARSRSSSRRSRSRASSATC